MMLSSAAASATDLAQVAERARRPRHPDELRIEPLRFRPDLPRLRSLPNGLRYVIARDPSLPLIRGELLFQTGSIDEPPKATGLASVVGELLRTGGSLTRSAEDVDEEIDLLGATLDVLVGDEVTRVSFSALSRDLDRILALVSDLVRNPAFREDRLTLSRDHLREEIRRRWDEPESIAQWRFADLVYGPQSRWARRPTPRSVDQMGQDACRAFHARWFVPDRAWLGLTGELSVRRTRRKIERLFGSWKRGRPQSRPSEAAKGASPGIYWIDRELPQAQVVVGHLGVPRLGPDHYALKVMNLIVAGGGFSSRLVKEVRTVRGLSYSVHGGVGEGLDRGIFRVDLKTQPARVAEALAVVQKVLEEARRRQPNPVEMQVAHDRVAHSFVFNFSSPGAIVARQLRHAVFGYPQDYLDTYLGKILEVGEEDVLRVARAHIQPQRHIVLIVGPEAAVAPLREGGRGVHEIPLDPEPQPTP
ncbi:MAG: pitrilysin family protein [Acidobacteriota bacterium]